MRKAWLTVLVCLAALRLDAAAQPGTFHADGDKSKKAIALSFDDGPGLFTMKILEILDQYKVKATFFMNGDQVEIRPQIAKEVQKRGHEIADHTYSHLNFYAYEKKNGPEKTKDKARDEIAKSKKMIEKHLGLAPTICRMPNGYHRPWLKDIAREFGYGLVNWTFGEDWLNVPGAKMTEDYVKQVRAGSILLFHDGGKDRSKTVQALPAVIQEAQKKGLAFLTVSEILP